MIMRLSNCWMIDLLETEWLGDLWLNSKFEVQSSNSWERVGALLGQVNSKDFPRILTLKISMLDKVMDISPTQGTKSLLFYSQKSHSTLHFFKTFHFLSLMVKVLEPIIAWYLLKEHYMRKFLTNYQLPVLSLIGFMEIWYFHTK